MGITAFDLMKTNVATLTPEMTLAEMDTVLMKRGISGAPVVERGRLIGVVSQTDLIRALWEGQHEAFERSAYYSSPYPVPISAIEYLAKDVGTMGDRMASQRVRDIMTPDPLVAHPDDDVEELAGRMVRDRIHRLPVTDPGTGKLVGIVTTLDLVNAISLHGLKSVL